MFPRVPLVEVTSPPLVRPGDRVAVLSPSAGLPAVFPHVHELGLRRLRDELGLVPVEYPTTRAQDAPPAARADDVVAAFADPTIAAVMATVGGDDQVRVLPHLDLDVLAANPKRFFGYSDNTNLLNVLVGLGMTVYHGGSTMVHLGRGGAPHPLTMASLRAALFEGGPFDLPMADEAAQYGRDWADPANLGRAPETLPASPWRWHGDRRPVEGRLWGGCLEILDWTLQVGRHVGPADHYAGAVLVVETSEEVPSATYVYRTLRHLGERGILGVAAGLVVARPVGVPFGAPLEAAAVAAHEDAQFDAVRRAVDEYHPGLPTLFGLDAGHTDPQLILPLGGPVRLDPVAGRVTVTY